MIVGAVAAIMTVVVLWKLKETFRAYLDYIKNSTVSKN
ncbi:hypothetical protein SAMN05444355_10483 [Flavobacterium frigoris]|uniref:Uncharacterized protein n=1 Tax=Flavobacterium frigoris TaxID=229204 RepID=A0A1H9IQH1_FLAFI|nr:hypothetical protein SAMN05444355_10483 [Flavobacterium frigoris]